VFAPVGRGSAAEIASGRHVSEKGAHFITLVGSVNVVNLVNLISHRSAYAEKNKLIERE
jgi:hypothetical protein